MLLRVQSTSPLQRGHRPSVGSSITKHLPSGFCNSFFKDPRRQSLCRAKCKMLSLEARAGPLWLLACHSHLLQLDPQLGLVGLAFWIGSLVLSGGVLSAVLSWRGRVSEPSQLSSYNSGWGDSAPLGSPPPLLKVQGAAPPGQPWHQRPGPSLVGGSSCVACCLSSFCSTSACERE